MRSSSAPVQFLPAFLVGDNDEDDQIVTVNVTARGDRSGMAVVVFSGQMLTQP